MSAPLLPDPPVPRDCDLRDFPFMPMDVARFRDSGLVALPNAEAFRAAVLAYCVAWHQVPGGSLPDDDNELCRLLGYGRDLRLWRKLREAGALRGWQRCRDGRLYHPVVSEKALAAWGRKAKQAASGRAGAAKRWGSNGTANGDANSGAMATPSASVMPRDSNREGDGEGEEKETSPPHPRKRGSERATAESDDFEAWWREYPRKVGKDGARRAYSAAVKRGATEAALLMALRRQRWPDEERFIPYPSTWLNGGRWKDDPEAAAPPKRGAQNWVWDALARQGGTPPDIPDASWPPTIDGDANEIGGEPPQ